MARPLVVIGFMGVGKTTLGRNLAVHRNVPHVDTDVLLEQYFGHPISEVFAFRGEYAFREAEREVVLRELERDDGAVLSLGGGAPLDEQIAHALSEHTVVLLDVPLDTAWERARESDRPLARDRTSFANRYAIRADAYAAVASAVIDSSDPDALIRASDALAALAAGPPGIRMTWAITAASEYPVYVGPGALAIRPPGLDGRAIAVSDEHVAAHHISLLTTAAGVIEIPAGEENKTLLTTERVWQAMVDQGVTRGDHLIALGGGIVGDLAGFAAACFQRGIDVVQAPTSIVAQVDSAYGGKTGVDLPAAKNYIGAYHQPRAVLADTSTLATLPPEEHAAGYAEILKTALIAGGRLWDRVASGAAVDERIIFDCARTKLLVVATDERDQGRRQVLNLGHTVGHALETVLGYGTLRHGEAVALGLLAALRLSDRDRLREQVAELLAAAGLPTTLSEHRLKIDAVIAAIGRDKKRVGGAQTPFVLVKAPGDVRHGQTVDLESVRAAIMELCR